MLNLLVEWVELLLCVYIYIYIFFAREPHSLLRLSYSSLSESKLVDKQSRWGGFGQRGSALRSVAQLPKTESDMPSYRKKKWGTKSLTVFSLFALCFGEDVFNLSLFLCLALHWFLFSHRAKSMVGYLYLFMYLFIDFSTSTPPEAWCLFLTLLIFSFIFLFIFFHSKHWTATSAVWSRGTTSWNLWWGSWFRPANTWRWVALSAALHFWSLGACFMCVYWQNSSLIRECELKCDVFGAIFMYKCK